MVLSGHTPYPIAEPDDRLPHIRLKLHNQIVKTALGAEKTVNWQHQVDIITYITTLKQKGYVVAALEQTHNSLHLPEFKPPEKLALIVGREVEGIEAEVLSLADMCLEIPMLGKKESFNVVQAAAMALYHCTFWDDIVQ